LAEISEERDKYDLEDKIQIFSNTDEKLKFLGKILTNDSSRKILQLLLKKEMTANEIANQTKLSLPLALYHINQMIKAGIVVISKTSTNGKNQPMKHYSAKHGIVILPEKASQKAKESKLFFRSLKNIMKFAGIGITSAISWIVTNSRNIADKPERENTGSVTVDGPDFNIISSLSNLEPITIALLVIVFGLTIERILSYLLHKRKKNGGLTPQCCRYC